MHGPQEQLFVLPTAYAIQKVFGCPSLIISTDGDVAPEPGKGCCSERTKAVALAAMYYREDEDVACRSLVELILFSRDPKDSSTQAVIILCSHCIELDHDDSIYQGRGSSQPEKVGGGPGCVKSTNLEAAKMRKSNRTEALYSG